VVTVYELHPNGILVRAQTPDLQHSGLVTWAELESAEFQPLEAMHRKVVNQLQTEIDRHRNAVLDHNNGRGIIV